MCTSEPVRARSPVRKTFLAYLAVSALCAGFGYGYSLFGHGVYSASMSLMFAYPLLAGALVFLLLSVFIPAANTVRRYRVWLNLYNSGVAALTAGSLLRGILEIAGTTSPYTVCFPAAGWLMTGIAALGFLYGAATR